MPSAPLLLAIAFALGSVTYACLYMAFASRASHIGFRGDYDAAASSCGRMAGLFAALAVASGAWAAFGGAGRRRLLLAKRKYGDEDVGDFADAVLPGSYTGLRKR